MINKIDEIFAVCILIARENAWNYGIFLGRRPCVRPFGAANDKTDTKTTIR
jgi:hypothetical protein